MFRSIRLLPAGVKVLDETREFDEGPGRVSRSALVAVGEDELGKEASADAEVVGEPASPPRNDCRLCSSYMRPLRLMRLGGAKPEEVLRGPRDDEGLNEPVCGEVDTALCEGNAVCVAPLELNDEVAFLVDEAACHPGCCSA